jgi:hypothetical protein
LACNPAGVLKKPPEISELTRRAWPLFVEARRLEAEGRYDEAFDTFAEANRLKREDVQTGDYVTRHAAGVGDLKRIFTPDFIRQHQTTNPVIAPIFIVGMPRSGSTLVEQILASHPNVHGLGESSALVHSVGDAYPFNPLGSFDVSLMTAKYLAAAKREGWRRSRRFTDKRLANYTLIGFIHMMFPRAIILHTMRDPADTCFSCFRRLFDPLQDTRFAYDLGDLGRYYVAYRDMMNHWAAVLMGRVINVDYESLVADPEGRTRWLLGACQLPWDDRCLRFYENDRPVWTNSAEQVREPIFETSIGRWQPYEKHLGPLFDALGPYAPKPSDRTLS